MGKTYKCDVCNYNATMSSSYKKHLTTKKHIMKMSGLFLMDKCIVDDNNTTTFKCYYCKKTFKNNNYKYTHIKRCKEKHDHEVVLQELQTTKNLNETLIEKQYPPITDDYIASIIEKCLESLMQKTDNTCSIVKPSIQINNITNNNITNNSNNNNNSNSNCINFNYIKKHYKNPKTIQECLALPLTETEIYNITKSTPAVGCEYLIKNRCIVGVELEDRPFHSIDQSRDKFAVFSENENNTKNWITQDGSDITKKFIPLIRSQYEKQYNNPLCDPAKIAEGISYMYTAGNRKIIKSIGKMTDLKNNLANSMKNKPDDKKSDDKNVDLENDKNVGSQNVDLEDVKDLEDINSEDMDLEDLEDLERKYTFL
jgi:hypothetical protein